jgi:aldehyde:ferredoxin oxidoreductase
MENGRIIRVDLSRPKIYTETVPERWKILGGRALTSAIVAEEVPPGCNPLDGENKIVICPGLLGGTSVPNSGRVSVGAKSPLTGGIKESNAGGTSGAKLARLGIKAIIIGGMCRQDVPHILTLSKDMIELRPYEELSHKGVYESVVSLNRIFDKAAVMLIGPAGENLLSAAGIATTDADQNPGRYCARGGLGAVMGSKRLKAIVIDDKRTKPRKPVETAAFRTAVKALSSSIMESPKRERYSKYGTNAGLAIINDFNALPTRGFTRGNFEKAASIDGEALRKTIIERGGTTTHGCMPGCMIKCSNVFPDENGNALVSPIEYETIGMIGSNCGIDSLDTIAVINRMCNDIGVDTIEIGGALGVAMQAGMLDFGDRENSIRLVREIGENTSMGKALGHGAAFLGKHLGLVDVPVVKGQTMAAYDPRALKGLGVTFATSPMGADHTAGHTLSMPVDPLLAEGQIEASRHTQLISAVYDHLGFCFFVNSVISTRLDLLSPIASAFTGENVTEAVLMDTARTLLQTEKQFNTRAGFTPEDDRLPSYFEKVKNPDAGMVFDIPHEDLQKVLPGRV